MAEKLDLDHSTAHNLKVIGQVAEERNVDHSTVDNWTVRGEVGEELYVDHIPKTLLCNAHPLMMFQGKIKRLFRTSTIL